MNQSMNFLVIGVLAASAFARKPVVTIPLAKQHVPVIQNGRTVMNKTAYFGSITTGEINNIQSFTVVFDTGSGHLMLPSMGCTSNTCRKHRQFDPSLSQSSRSSSDRVEILYGTGEVVGDTTRERVCLGQFDNLNAGNPEGVDEDDEDEDEEDGDARFCIDLDVVVATEMTDEPFSSFDFDGVMGLGLQSLAVAPSYSFLGRISSAMHTRTVPRMFGVFISDEDSVASEISFGGYDETRMLSSLQWTPVNKPELGYWQVRIKSLSVDDVPFPVCDDGTCIAILDSGTSSIGVPRPFVHDVHYKLVRKLSHTIGSELAEQTDCRNIGGPTLAFHLEGGMTISLNAGDYSRPAPFHARTNLLSSRTDFDGKPSGSESEDQSAFCRATLLPVTMDDPMPVKTFILGEPALRKYYTAYDWGEERVGFALASPPLSI